MTYLELRTFLDKWIRNSAISAFSQMRLNTILNEIIDKVEAGGGGDGSSDASDLTSGILDNARLDAVPQSKIVGLVAELARANALAPDSKIVWFGDSLTADGIGGLGYNYTPLQFNPQGFTTFSEILSGSILFQPIGGNKGVSGDTTALMIARLGASLALKPKVAVVLAGTNDIADGVSAVNLEANLQKIYNAFKSIGAIVIAPTIWPRYSPSTFTSGQETIRQSVNTWIKTQGSSNLIPVDMETAMSNSGLYRDGIHLNSTGGYTAGSIIGPVINSLTNGANVSNLFQQDNSFIANLALSGTGGTKTSSSGASADSWTLDGSNAGGATVTGSKGSAGNLIQQIITLSGNYSGNGKQVDFTQAIFPSTMLGTDTYEGMLDFEIQNTLSANIVGIRVSLTMSKTGTSSYYNFGYNINDQLRLSLPVGRYQMRTPPGIPNGNIAPDFVQLTMSIHLKDAAGSTAISDSIIIHKLALRRIV